MVNLPYEQYRNRLLDALESAFDSGVVDYYATEDILSFVRHWSPEGGYQPPVVSHPESKSPPKVWEKW